MRFLPRELEATHAAPVSSSSGVTGTVRVLRTVCGSWSCSLAYGAEGGEDVLPWQQSPGRGEGVLGKVRCVCSLCRRHSRRWRAEDVLTLRKTGSTPRSLSPTSSSPLLSSMGILGEAGGRVRQQAASLPPWPHQSTAGQWVAFCPQRARSHPPWGGFKGRPDPCPESLTKNGHVDKLCATQARHAGCGCHAAVASPGLPFEVV